MLAKESTKTFGTGWVCVQNAYFKCPKNLNREITCHVFYFDITSTDSFLYCYSYRDNLRKYNK